MHIYKHSGFSAVTQFSYVLKQVNLLCHPTPSLSLVTCPLSQRSALFSCAKKHTSGSVRLKPSSKVLHRPPSFLSHPLFSLIPVMLCLARSFSSLHQCSFPHISLSTFFSSFTYSSYCCSVFSFPSLDVFPCHLFQAPAVLLPVPIFHFSQGWWEERSLVS